MALFLYPNCAKIIFIDSKIKQMKLTYKYYINVYKKMICEIVFVYIYKKNPNIHHKSSTCHGIATGSKIWVDSPQRTSVFNKRFPC